MSNGVPHRVLDQMAKFEAKVNGKVSELINKHNDLAAKITALEAVIGQVAAYTASEMGRAQGQVQGQMQSIGQSLSGIDLNILALAELNKEVIGQLTQIDVFFTKITSKSPELEGGFDLSDEEVAKVKTDAQAWYSDLLKSSFSRAREVIEEQEKKLAEARAAAVAQEAETARAAAEESSVEAELKKAEEIERQVVSATSGGEGSSFPEGAEIFGG